MSEGGRRIFCHSCREYSDISDAILICQRCGSEFVEEAGTISLPDEEEPELAESPTRDDVDFPFRLLSNAFGFGMDGSVVGRRVGLGPRQGIGRNPNGRVNVGRGGDPPLFFRQLIESLVNGRQEADGGLSFQMGDYVFGNLDEAISRLMDMDGGKFGAPAATPDQMASLPRTKYTRRQGEDPTHCPICLDEFIDGNEVIELPCHHIYHTNCILEWLKIHNPCPVCRESV